MHSLRARCRSCSRISQPGCCGPFPRWGTFDRDRCSDNCRASRKPPCTCLGALSQDVTQKKSNVASSLQNPARNHARIVVVERTAIVEHLGRLWRALASFGPPLRSVLLASRSRATDRTSRGNASSDRLLAQLPRQKKRCLTLELPPRASLTLQTIPPMVGSDE